LDLLRWFKAAGTGAEKFATASIADPLPVQVVSGGGGGGAGVVDTELPAAAALSDVMANPTTPSVGACQMYWNGSVWSRVSFAGGDADGIAAGLVGPFTPSRQYNGATWDRERCVTTLKTAQGAAVASGSDVTVWTPAVGKKFRLYGVRARASNAGRYEVRDASGTVIVYTYLAANVWTDIVDMPTNGYLSAAANNALLLRNQSGGNADVDVVAWGLEE